MVKVYYNRNTDTFSFGDYKTKSLGEINAYVQRWFPTEEIIYEERSEE